MDQSRDVMAVTWAKIMWGLKAVTGHKPRLVLMYVISVLGALYVITGSYYTVSIVQRGMDQYNTITDKRPAVLNKRFKEDESHQLLILSYQRCGSSFLGDIFGKHPDVTYFYEPLDGLYTHLYGTKEGWNVPSDIYSHNNGSARTPPTGEIEAVTKLLDNLYNCRISNVPTAVLYNKFWKAFRYLLTSLTSFTNCAIPKTVNRLNQCKIEHLSDACPRRFDPDHYMIETCSHILQLVYDTNYTRDLDFWRYAQCVKNIRSRASTCERDLQMSCTRKHFRAIKTVRASMASVEKLILNNPGLRVIHLIRDPRAVMLSRKRFGGSVRSLYSSWSKNGKMDLGAEALIYCRTVLHDLIVQRQLAGKYPGVIREVIYEDLVSDLIQNVKNLYNFIDVPFVTSVEKWIQMSSYGINGSRNASVVATKWQNVLTFQENKDIITSCQPLLTKMSHWWTT